MHGINKQAKEQVARTSLSDFRLDTVREAHQVLLKGTRSNHLVKPRAVHGTAKQDVLLHRRIDDPARLRSVAHTASATDLDAPSLTRGQ